MLSLDRVFSGAPGVVPALSSALPLVAPGATSRLVSLVDGAAVQVNAAAGGTFSLACSSDAVRVIQPPSAGRQGQRIVVRVVNGSGGNLTNTTFHASIRQPAITLPTNGLQCDYSLAFDGVSWALVAQGVSVTTTVTPTPPVMFKNSQWAFALGNSASAFRDGTNFDASISGTGAQTAVETAASLGLVGWPTANVWRNRAHAANWPTTTVQWDLGVPSVGDVRYFRYYYQNTVPNTVTPDGTVGNIEHGVETSDANVGGGDGWNPIHIPKMDGTWFLEYREISTAFFYAMRTTFLQKNTTYRMESRVEYVTGGYQVQFRVFDAANVKLIDTQEDALGALDFYQLSPVNNPALLLRNATFSLADFGDHRWLRFGNNGPSSNFPVTNIVAGDGWANYGAAAVSFDNWCGVYVPGNG